MEDPEDALYFVDEQQVPGEPILHLSVERGPSSSEGGAYVRLDRPWSKWRLARVRARLQRKADKSNYWENADIP